MSFNADKMSLSALFEHSLPVLNDRRLILPEKLMKQFYVQLPPLVLHSSSPLRLISNFCFVLFFLRSLIQVFTVRTVGGGVTEHSM